MNHVEDKLVSIIIPTYKRDLSFVSRAVMSVLSQTYPNIEVILVDDSPSDYAERDSVKKFAEEIGDGRLKYLQNERNIGGALSRNRGIDCAAGEYVSFLDDDDEYLPEKIEKQLHFMLDNNCDMSFSNMKMYNNNGKIVDVREYKDIWSFENKELLKYHIIHHLTGTPTYMFKTEKLRQIGGFEDVPIMQEYMLMLKCIKSDLSIRYFDSCDVKIYKHIEGGITQGQKKIDAEKKLYEMKKEYYPILTKKQKKYVAFRHWVVMAVAYKRNKQYFRIIGAGVRAFFASPAIFFSEAMKFFKKVNSANAQKGG